MNRTCAPRRPPAWGRSTRIGYQLGPSPTISATLLHVRPESPENWITPSCSGVNVDPLCLVHSCSQTAVRPRRSMGGEVNVSEPPAAYHEYLPAPGALTLSRHHPRHPLSSGSAPASDTSSAETLVPTARNARTASKWRSVRQSVRSTPRGTRRPQRADRLPAPRRAAHGLAYRSPFRRGAGVARRGDQRFSGTRLNGWCGTARQGVAWVVARQRERARGGQVLVVRGWRLRYVDFTAHRSARPHGGLAAAVDQTQRVDIHT